MITKKLWLRLVLITLAFFLISSLGFGAAKPAGKQVEAKAALIDINTATKDQLKALQGIGNAYSQKTLKADLTLRRIN